MVTPAAVDILVVAVDTLEADRMTDDDTTTMTDTTDELVAMITIGVEVVVTTGTIATIIATTLIMTIATIITIEGIGGGLY